MNYKKSDYFLQKLENLTNPTIPQYVIEYVINHTKTNRSLLHIKGLLRDGEYYKYLDYAPYIYNKLHSINTSINKENIILLYNNLEPVLDNIVLAIFKSKNTLSTDFILNSLIDIDRGIKPTYNNTKIDKFLVDLDNLGTPNIFLKYSRHDIEKMVFSMACEKLGWCDDTLVKSATKK
jgi:hypothetical protein